ncbi:MAG TPA: helix-turn-helix domain-containing protein [Fibrella sp.]
MTFYFSAYSTPLLFGFVQAWVYAILLWVRGRREERLSDVMLGWVLIGCALNIWDYMLGFGGIEILWQALEFFPRSLGYLFPVLCYFYLKSQFNAGFQFSRRDAWHAVPFLLYVVYHIGVFAMGRDFVTQWEKNVHDPYHIGDAEYGIGLIINLVYLFKALRLYRQYRVWTKTQFSETDTISFRWFRNFLIAFAIMSLFSFIMTVLSLTFDLTFWQNWWDKLAGVVLIYYVSIQGYAQPQLTRRLAFQPTGVSSEPVLNEEVAEPTAVEPDMTAIGQQNRSVLAIDAPRAVTQLPDLSERLSALLRYMDTEKPYLEPDLALPDLARRLHTNPVLLSQVINAGAGKNFNDFVNEYRVDEFKRQVRAPDNAHLSFLGIAHDCGFNSKATFNRAFKKFTGTSPKQFAEA